MPIRAFLSYSHKDRELAHHLKDELKEFGVEAFLAHDDIPVSERWRRAILKNLRNCELFIPILTEAYTKSKWTDQEAGFALAKGKRIVPLKVDVTPYGLIEVYQALRLRQVRPIETCWRIMESLKERESLRQKVREGVISSFLKSSTFEIASKNLTQLVKFRPFTSEQLVEIVKTSSRNQNIYGCHGAQRHMEVLLEDARGKVPRAWIARYRNSVESWPY